MCEKEEREEEGGRTGCIQNENPHTDGVVGNKGFHGVLGEKMCICMKMCICNNMCICKITCVYVRRYVYVR